MSSGPTATGPAAEVLLLETDGAGGPPVPGTVALAEPGAAAEGVETSVLQVASCRD